VREWASGGCGMSRYRVFMVVALSGAAMLSACSPAAPADRTSSVPASVHFSRYTQEFASPLPASPGQAAVVEGFRQGQVLWVKSEIAWHLVAPVRGYVTGQALTHLMAAVKAGKAYDITPAGMDRFFMTRVTAVNGPNATVATCDDGSNFEEENPRTGKIDASFAAQPQQTYAFETWRMVRLGGHWAITAFSLAFLPSHSALACQPGMSGAGAPRPPDVAVLLRKMRTALRNARSVRISGTVHQGGKNLGLNLAMTRSGGMSGQISEDGAAFTVLTTQGQTYLELSAAFLKLSRLPAAACTLFCGKYLEFTPVQSQQLLSGLNMPSLMDSITNSIADLHAATYVGTGTANAQPAWLLMDRGGDLAYIALHGRPYLLRVVEAQPSAGAVSLTQWDAVQIPAPPPPGQIVSVSQLTG
jgi:hypothetical protein